MASPKEEEEEEEGQSRNVQRATKKKKKNALGYFRSLSLVNNHHHCSVFFLFVFSPATDDSDGLTIRRISHRTHTHTEAKLYTNFLSETRQTFTAGPVAVVKNKPKES